MIRRSRRGFSLVELLLAMALLGLLGALGIVNLRSAVAGGDSQSLALVASEQLRLARQTAMSTHQPVAVMLPTNAGSSCLSQSLYLATGQSMAHVSRVINFASEHPKALLFTGTWGLSAGSFCTFPATPGLRHRDFNVDQWLTNPNITGYSLRKDYALVFMPDGSAISNGVPFYQGAYYLVSASGAVISGVAPPPSQTSTTSSLNYFTTLSVGKPWSIAITPSGQITLQSGLPGVVPGLVNPNPVGVAGVCAPPQPTVLPASAPVAQSVAITPTPGSGLPSGVNTTVSPGQRLTLTVNGTDTSGRDLFVDWTCTPDPSNSTPNAGNFSFPGRERMTWDTANQVWKSSWDWKAPLTAQPGDQFTFQCAMGDGLTALVVPTAAQTVKAVPTDRLYMLANQTQHGAAGLYVIKSNLDGSEPTNLIGPLGFYSDSLGVSQDGSIIMVGHGAGYDLYSGDTGALLANVNPPGFYATEPCALSPRGDRVAFWRLNSTPTWHCELMVCNADGSNVRLVDPNLGGYCYAVPHDIAWSPDQTKLAYSASSPPVSPPWTLRVVDVTGANPRMPFPGRCAQAVCWSADSQSVYLSFSNWGTTSELYRYEVAANALANGGNPVTLAQPVTGGGVWPFMIGASSDGQNLFYQSGGMLWKNPTTPFQAPPTKLCPSPPGGGSLYSFAVAKH